MRRDAPMRMKKDKSSRGFHGFLSFRDGVIREICVIRKIHGCFVKTRDLFSEQDNILETADPDPEWFTAPIPTTLWVELTSKCPYDCVFCSRGTLRGDGEHMEPDIFRSLIAALIEPEIIRLNYSGESAHYPHLLEAIRASKATGAQTELVTALSSVSPRTLQGLVEAGLDRLTISLHTMDPAQYTELYRHASLDLLQKRAAELFSWKEKLRSATPQVDFAFVAMNANLDQLLPVARYAESLDCRRLAVLPVIRRDPIPCLFETELHDGRLSDSFKHVLLETVEGIQRQCARLAIEVQCPELEPQQELDAVPRHYAAALPEGARIRSCDQNPWETAHVLANGDVVVCEVQDSEPLGNLREQSLAEIWRGAKYRAFRRQYLNGESPACRTCTWKMACVPSELSCRITAAENAGQLLRGWHARDSSGTLWSKGDAWVMLGNRPPRRLLRLQGLLPRSLDGSDNYIEAASDGFTMGRIWNPAGEGVTFDTCFELPAAGRPDLQVKLSTRTTFRPADACLNPDTRRLGFALFLIELL